MPKLKSSCTLVIALLCSAIASAQDGERWFQIEVSIFTNEVAADRSEEVWTPQAESLAYPGNTRRIDQLIDLLMIDELIAMPDPALDVPLDGEESTPTELLRQAISGVGPPAANPNTGFRLFDFQRDPYVQLAPSESDFQQTNRALERSAEHRLLFHGHWRQPMPDVGNGTAIYVTGGSEYGGQHELQGSVTLHFNSNRDRVVVDADLWLTEFMVSELGLASRIGDVGAATDTAAQWTLPAIPEHLETAQTAEVAADFADTPAYSIRRLYQFLQSRDMRSTEFHYLDHPALGLVILVNPYDVPELPPPPPEFLGSGQASGQ